MILRLADQTVERFRRGVENDYEYFYLDFGQTKFDHACYKADKTTIPCPLMSEDSLRHVRNEIRNAFLLEELETWRLARAKDPDGVSICIRGTDAQDYASLWIEVQIIDDTDAVMFKLTWSDTYSFLSADPSIADRI